MRKILFRGILTLFFTSLAVLGYSQCATPQGNQTSYGSNYWIGYAYQAQNNFSNANYYGYFNEQASFFEGFCGNNCSFAINGCPITTEQFTVRFKMNISFTCGDYAFTIGADDGVRLSIDGGSTYLINDYTDHGYRTASATTTLAEGNYNLILEYYEAGGGNQVSFSYTPANGNTTGPGVIAASQSLCQSAPFDPAPFTSTSAATFCAGSAPTYQWQESTDQFAWSNISGATSATYDAPSYSTLGTKYFRRWANNGSITIYSNTIIVTTATPPGDPSVFGNNVWNAYSYSSATVGVNYHGFYTENNLSFNTATRWTTGASPSSANTTTGLAFSGCSAIPVNNYTVSFKRTNFPCGYYQIDMPAHDDNVTLVINGVQVFQHIGCCDVHNSIWTGYLGSTSTIDATFTNFSGPGQLALNVAISATPPVTANSATTVCAGTTATLTASSPVSGVTYSWAPDSNNPAGTITTSATNPSIVIQPVASGNYIVTMTHTASGCTSTATVPVTVSPNPTTAISVSPSILVTDCPGSTFTLTASGAASYTWSADTGAAGGLSSTTGFSVTANPQQTTTYTVVGTTNCNALSAQVTITINAALVSTFPTTTWNVYGFNSQTIGTNYVGYYTENGTLTGANTYSFDTRTRWPDGGAPSTTTASNGNAWVGCTMSNTNISLSFKRSGFTCGIYQLDVPAHDDEFFLFIDGVQVAQHIGCCDAHTNVWTGALSAASQVEWQMKQGGGGAYLQVQFTSIAQPAGQSTWMGGVSTDWFNAANWCGGVPTSTTNVLVPSAGPRFMPAIASASAVCQNITVNAGVAASAYSNAIAAASLTTSTTNNLSVSGNWVNNGTYIPNTGSITFTGSSNTTISSSAGETFYNFIVNKTGAATLTLSSGAQRVSNTMTFTNGIVTPTATLEFLNGASAASASNTSYVAGLVRKTGTNAFSFPVGAGGFYRPISISAPSVATDSYTAQYFFTSPNPTYSTASKEGTLNHVGGGEYWILNRPVGATNIQVTLSWASTTGGVDDLASLRVAGWNGTSWRDLGNSATTGNVTSGTVRSATTPLVSMFGPFTIASANSNNPLPISLLDFTCVLNSDGIVNITWNTLSELNNDYFDIERSTDGEKFISLEKRIKGAGTTTQKRAYSTEDFSPPFGKVYYRLKQVDFDGKSSYSEVRMIENFTTKIVLAYPNPVDNVLYIDKHEKVLNSIAVFNSLGVEQRVPVTMANGRIILETSTLPSGFYMVRVVLNDELSTLRVVVRR